MKKVLVVETPNRPTRTYEWNGMTIEELDLDKYDIMELEAGNVVWNGTTGMSLEDEDE